MASKNFATGLKRSALTVALGMCFAGGVQAQSTSGAIYGKANDTPGVDYSELLEQKTFELGGIKTLISRNHYDEERFWSVYDRDRYQAIKRRADPHNLLRDLYEKFAPAR